MRNAFINTFLELAPRDPRVVLISADIGAIVFDRFRAEHPDQYLNAGVSEANMIGVAAGLAMAGRRPFVYTIVPFVTLRCIEQIRVDLCIQQLPVTVVGVGGGLAYSTLGPTHHAIEDIAIMRALPGMEVIVPATPAETRQAAASLLQQPRTAYLRLGLAGEPALPENDTMPYVSGRAKILRSGKDATLLATGRCVGYALQVSDVLADDGISIGVVNMHTVKPLDREAVAAVASGCRRLFTYEEHSVTGGLGGAVAEILAEQGGPPLHRFGLPDAYCLRFGTHDELLHHCGLLPAQVATAIRSRC